MTQLHKIWRATQSSQLLWRKRDYRQIVSFVIAVLEVWILNWIYVTSTQSGNLMKHWWSLDALVTCLCQVLCDAKQVPGPVTLSCLIRGFVTVFFLINAKHTVDTLSINPFSLAEQKSRLVKVKWVYSKRAAHYCTLSQMCISSQGDALS